MVLSLWAWFEVLFVLLEVGGGSVVLLPPLVLGPDVDQETTRPLQDPAHLCTSHKVNTTAVYSELEFFNILVHGHKMWHF